MNVFRFIFTTLTILFFISCENNPSSDVDAGIVATEKWHITDSGDSRNYAAITINQQANGTIRCTGNWYFDFYGSSITCAIMQGAIVKSGATLKFTCSGSATYPPDEDGYIEKSDFTLLMTGPFSEGTASGDWSISFTDEEWDEWAPGPGSFTATLTEGSGITE